MTTDDRSVSDYVDRLEAELRRRGASASDIAEAGANVRERTAEAGRGPEDVFGSPAEHASRLVAIDAPATSPVRSALRLAVVLLAGWFGAGAAVALARGEDSLGLPAVVPLLVCVALLVGAVVDARRGSARSR